MSRLATTFAELKAAGKTALVPYITAGDPKPEVTVPLMHDLVKAGADVIELGMPFSDPMADGPVIQAACERALAAGMSLKHLLQLVTEFRQSDQSTPVVIMGYANPLEVMGYEEFANQAAEAGVDGALIVDLPPEEAAPILPLFQQYELDPVFLLAPTSSEKRIQLICEAASGFVYYVSLKGVTGAATLDVEQVAEKLALIRQYTSLPVGVGFGVKDAETAEQVGRVADAVVVGSAIVKRIAEHQAQPEQARKEIVSLLTAMRSALDKADQAA